MINGLYIADSQGEILIERTYTATSVREQIKKLIRSQLSNSENSDSNIKAIWEIEDAYIFATRRARVIFLALAQNDVFIPEIYEILIKLESVLEAALGTITIDNIRANNSEILIV